MHLGLLLVSLLLGACVSTAEKKGDLRETHPLRYLANWPQSSETVEARVRLANPDMIDYLKLVNQAESNPMRATPVPPSDELTTAVLEDYRQAIASLPQEFRLRIAGGVLGFFLVRNLGSTAKSFTVRDEQGLPKKAFILLDIDAINKTANEWASWKESTAFDAGIYNIQVTLENPEENTRANAIQFILLHEIGQVLAILRGTLPEAGKAFTQIRRPYPFLNLDWTYAASGFERKSDATSPKLAKVVYYSVGSRQPNADMMPIMDELQTTSFFTLYAATDPFHDFADAFALYMHSLILQKPFRVEVYKGAELQKVYEPCFEEERCKSKLRFLDEFVRTLD
jgi:hypothetical protein